MTMPYRLLGGSGVKVPVLSFGTATFGGTTEFFRAWGETQEDEARRLVDVALEAGAAFFDTADSYSAGRSEEILGKAIAGRRGRVLVATKASYRTGDGPNDVGSSRGHLVEACEASLRRLGTDHLDLWYLHGFDALTPIEETLRALDDLVASGKVRAVGCSNFSGWHLMKSLALADRHGSPRYAAHQLQYSLLAREVEWELLPLALEERVGTVVWSPLAGGRLSGKLGRDRPPPPRSRAALQAARGPPVPPERLYAVLDTLEAIAGETGRTVSQVALAWVMARPSVASVVVGARDEAQLRENLAAAELTLTGEGLARLDAASDQIPVYPYWHQRTVFGERNPPLAAPRDG